MNIHLLCLDIPLHTGLGFFLVNFWLGFGVGLFLLLMFGADFVIVTYKN